jgi:predicted GTPase
VTFVDSPGLADFEQEVVFLKEIIATSDIILFVVDGKQ